MLLLKLLWSFAQIGLFSFGGGYAALPLIQNQVVELHGWLTLQEFTDVVTISQMTPGPIALNAASFVGTRVAGLSGAVIASFGCVLPSLIIVLFLAWFYYRYRSLRFMQGILSGLRPAVVALIASAGLAILFLALFGSTTLPSSFEEVNLYAVSMFVIGFIVMRLRKINPILMILGSGVLTVGLSLL
jgi:chromate transporter